MLKHLHIDIHIPEESSIFTAEACALLLALDYIESEQQKASLILRTQNPVFKHWSTENRSPSGFTDFNQAHDP